MGILLLGCGEMGAVIGADLAGRYDGELTFADRDMKRAEALKRRLGRKDVKVAGLDATDKDELVKLVRSSGAEIVINAINYYFNLSVMNGALKAGVHYLDLGGLFHTTKKQLKLDGAFRKSGLLAIPGCGSSPGITNVMAAYGAEGMETIESIDVSFADKDKTHYEMPFVLPYSIQTLFDEFSEKPAVFKNRRVEFVEPLGRETYIDFPPPLGKAGCFYTLHSEVATLPYSFKGIKECSFRGGFDVNLVDKARFLILTGFSSNEPIELSNGAKVSPKEISTKILSKFVPGEDVKIDDLEFLRVELKGKMGGLAKRVVVYCEDFSNKKWNIPAGSWNTGVAPSVAAQMILKNEISAKGVVPPEKCIPPETFFKELEKRDMKIWKEVTEVHRG